MDCDGADGSVCEADGGREAGEQEVAASRGAEEEGGGALRLDRAEGEGYSGGGGEGEGVHAQVPSEAVAHCLEAAKWFGSTPGGCSLEKTYG